MTLGLEICNRYETHVVNTARQALALADIRYTGPITFESFSSAVIAAGLSSDLVIWHNLWSDGDDLARYARIFITNHFTVAGAS